MSVGDAARLMAEAPFRWWIAGGHALELHVGRAWRGHHDLDIGIVRSELSLVYPWLRSWQLQVAAAGESRRWRGEPLKGDRHENNIWARRSEASPWSFDLVIGEGGDDGWVYRRDPSIRRPWPQAVLHTERGIPYLAPELQLLFKSSDPRPHDDTDAEWVLPALSEPQAAFLAEHLPASHPWRDLLVGEK